MSVIRMSVSSFCPLLVLVLAAGCSQERGPYRPLTRADGQRPMQTRDGVTMLDQEVRNSFILLSHTAARAPAGQIQARLTMQNAFREQVWADVRFVFFNKSGEPVEKSQWQNVGFASQEVVLVKGNSLRSNVATFNVQFRNLRTASGKKITYANRVYEHGRWRQSVLPQ